VTSADRGVTLSTAKTLPTGVVANTTKKVLRSGGYVGLGAVEFADEPTKVWRTPVGSYTWSAPLDSMTYLGGLLGPGMKAGGRQPSWEMTAGLDDDGAKKVCSGIMSATFV
jgi:hypothetical protein